LKREKVEEKDWWRELIYFFSCVCDDENCLMVEKH
jgi:hypothetical protein